MPEQLIKKFKKSILPQYKICFAWAFVMGLVAHLYKITNWLPNWDSLVFRHDVQNMLAMGRWFLCVVCAPGSFYDLPLVAGLFAIIFHALGAVCIVKMFNVRKNITAALIGSVVATFPTVTSVMMYNYVSDGYALAFLISCIAAMLVAKDKPKIVVSAILIALSCGIYQAYITVTIVLLLLSIIFELIYKSTDIKKILTKCIKFFFAGVLGMTIYYVVFNILLKITGTQVLEYQGFDNAAAFIGIDIFASLYTIKDSFVNYFFDFSNGLSVFSILNCLVFISTLILYLSDIIRNKLHILRIFFVCVFVVLLPVGASVLCFLNSAIDFHNLMKMGFVAFYLLLIMQYESKDFKKDKLNFAKSWAILGVVGVLVFNQVVVANVSYHELNMAYEKSYGTLIRIADRIEQTEKANDCDKILVLGCLPGSEAYSVNLPPDITGATNGYILRADDEIVGQSVLCSAINDYCGKNYKFLGGAEKSELMKKIDTDTLDNWPMKNSISVVDDVIVIKLGDEKVD